MSSSRRVRLGNWSAWSSWARRGECGKWAAALLLWAALLPAHASAAACTFKPALGQAGKDVIWVPTPDGVAERMLRIAQVGAQDDLVDLGSGDGKIVILAARLFGVRGRGIEYHPDMVELSRCLAQEAAVAGLTRFEQGDIFKSDFSQASVVTMYLLPELNLRLRPILFQKMRPGTRIVSHQFSMGEWTPDETSSVDGLRVYLWVIPAHAGGSWRLAWRGNAGEIGTDLTIEQNFQRIEGKARFGRLEASLRDPRMRGDRISFELMDEQGVLRAFTGRVQGDRIEGTAVDPHNRSVAFTAVRTGPAPLIRGAAP